MSREYLGDGLYVDDDGWQFELTAPRSGGEHTVFMDGSVLQAFLKYVERQRAVRIEVTTRTEEVAGEEEHAGA